MLLAGTLAAMLTTWVTFVPCFLWIFLGAPFAERMRGNVALSSAMTAITAAVVGVVLNLAVWFALHTIFAEVFEFRSAPMRFDVPILSSVSLPALLLTVAAMVAMFRFKAGAPTVIAGCGGCRTGVGFGSALTSAGFLLPPRCGNAVSSGGCLKADTWLWPFPHQDLPLSTAQLLSKLQPEDVH